MKRDLLMVFIDLEKHMTKPIWSFWWSQNSSENGDLKHFQSRWRLHHVLRFSLFLFVLVLHDRRDMG